jgi:hypothetical protein
MVKDNIPTLEPWIGFQLTPYKPTAFKVPGVMDQAPQTPSKYFNKRYPDISLAYGAAFLEHAYEDGNEFKRVSVVGMNDDFFAGLLGGDKALGHQVVFYVPEQQFYFYDCRFGYFVPTTEEKLMILLSQYLIRCCQEMPHFTDIGNLFITFRSEARLKRIVQKAKSLLSADRSFFEAPNGHKRRCGDRILDPAIEPAHKLFIREAIIAEPERILTTNECFENYTAYCEIQKLEPAERKSFTGLMTEGIKEQFGLGFRKDLKGADGKYHRGWKGLTCQVPVVADTPPAELVDVSKN